MATPEVHRSRLVFSKLQEIHRWMAKYDITIDDITNFGEPEQPIDKLKRIRKDAHVQMTRRENMKKAQQARMTKKNNSKEGTVNEERP